MNASKQRHHGRSGSRSLSAIKAFNQWTSNTDAPPSSSVASMPQPTHWTAFPPMHSSCKASGLAPSWFARIRAAQQLLSPSSGHAWSLRTTCRSASLKEGRNCGAKWRSAVHFRYGSFFSNFYNLWLTIFFRWSCISTRRHFACSHLWDSQVLADEQDR